MPASGLANPAIDDIQRRLDAIAPRMQAQSAQSAPAANYGIPSHVPPMSAAPAQMAPMYPASHPGIANQPFPVFSHVPPPPPPQFSHPPMGYAPGEPSRAASYNDWRATAPLSSAYQSAAMPNPFPQASPQPGGASSPEFANIKSSLDRLSQKLQSFSQPPAAPTLRTDALMQEIRGEFANLRKAMDAKGIDQSQIERIATGVKQLQENQNAQPDQLNYVANEIQALRIHLNTAAPDGVVQVDLNPIQKELENSFAALGSRLEMLANDQGAIGSLTQAFELSHQELTEKIDLIGNNLSQASDRETVDQLKAMNLAIGEMPANFQISEMQSNLLSIGKAVEHLAMVGESNAQEKPDFGAIESRLDEITRGLVAITVGGNSGAAGVELERIEARISTLAKTVDKFVAGGAMPVPVGDNSNLDRLADELRVSLAEINSKVDAIASGTPQREEYAHLDALVKLPEEMKASLETVTDRIANLEPLGNENIEGLATQINRLSERLDNLAVVPLETRDGATAAVNHDPAEITKTLNELVARIDSLHSAVEAPVVAASASQTEHGNSDGFVSLENQLNEIAAQLGAISAPGADFGPLDARLENIEQGLAANRDITIEVATQAAEQAAIHAANEVAKNVGMSGNSNGDGTQNAPLIDPAILTDLASDVRNLSENSKSYNATNLDTFDAVSETLSSIVDRLGSIEGQMIEASKQSDQIVVSMENFSQIGLGISQAVGQHQDTQYLQGGADTADSQQYVSQEALPGYENQHLETAEHAISAEQSAYPQETLADAIAGPQMQAPSLEMESLPEVTAAPVEVAIQPEWAAESSLGANSDGLLDDDVLLEPGSGNPDLAPPQETVVQPQADLPPVSEESTGTDFIAAARRAAQAAAMEADAVQEEIQIKTASKKGFLTQLPQLFAKRKKIILIAAAAVVIAAMAVPLASNLISSQNPTAEVAGSQVPMEPQSSIGDEGTIAQVETSQTETNLLSPPTVEEVAENTFAPKPAESTSNGFTSREVQTENIAPVSADRKSVV